MAQVKFKTFQSDEYAPKEVHVCDFLNEHPEYEIVGMVSLSYEITVFYKEADSKYRIVKRPANYVYDYPYIR